MTCPICRKPADPAYRPFCSRRCADVDLGRWLTGSYVVPGGPADDATPEPDDLLERAPSDGPPRPGHRG